VLKWAKNHDFWASQCAQPAWYVSQNGTCSGSTTSKHRLVRYARLGRGVTLAILNAEVTLVCNSSTSNTASIPEFYVPMEPSTSPSSAVCVHTRVLYMETPRDNINLSWQSVSKMYRRRRTQCVSVRTRKVRRVSFLPSFLPSFLDARGDERTLTLARWLPAGG